MQKLDSEVGKTILITLVEQRIEADRVMQNLRYAMIIEKWQGTQKIVVMPRARHI